MKALVTGAAGQLGRALVRQAPAGIELTALDRTGLDLTDAASIAQGLDAAAPTVVINAAAYTAVDRAESEPDHAHAVNAAGVGALARACGARGIRLIHVSTDFVFDGSLGRPYRPDDPPHPLSVYGASKLEGERQVQAQAGLDWRIVRTAWVYAPEGHNFVRTMLRLFAERPTVRVVADQVGSPTSAASLADCLWRAALEGGTPAILHFTDAGVASWYDFAQAIYEEGRALGLVRDPVEVVPIATEDYPTPARRPSYSVLDKRPAVDRLGLRPVHWRENLRTVLRSIRELGA